MVSVNGQGGGEKKKKRLQELNDMEEEKSSKLLRCRGKSTNEWPPSFQREHLHFISTLIWTSVSSDIMTCKQ